MTIWKPKQLAAYIQVSEMTIYRWLKKGKIAGGGKPKGRQWVIIKEVFDAAFDKQISLEETNRPVKSRSKNHGTSHSVRA